MNRLKEFRQSRRMKQIRLSEATGIPRSVISALEVYGDRPSASDARTLAAYFGTKVVALFPDGTKPVKPRGRKKSETEYMPPVPDPLPAVPYPSQFMTRCRKCGTSAWLVTDDVHPNIGDLKCLACGAEFKFEGSPKL